MKVPLLHQFSWFTPCHILAIGFGSGFSPIMPGTVGSIFALLFWLLWGNCNRLYYVGVVCFATFLGIYICGRTATVIGAVDPKAIVWDEFVGLWITLFALPHRCWQWIAVAFLLFRLLDIYKPWPIGTVENLYHGGIGIMMDDIVAGLIGAFFLWVLGLLFS